jgi:hypothetical protein
MRCPEDFSFSACAWSEDAIIGHIRSRKAGGKTIDQFI